MLAEEGEHLAPAVHRLLGTVERTVPVEEAVAGAVVAVELVALAEPLELGFVDVDLFRPDDELKKLAKLAVKLDVAAALRTGSVDAALAAVAGVDVGGEFDEVGILADRQ